jgi:hypothetical protein
MNKRYRVTLTQEDIDHGVPFSPFRCPFALALARRFHASVSLIVANALIFDTHDDERAQIFTLESSEAVRKAIVAFDIEGKAPRLGDYYFTEA